MFDDLATPLLLNVKDMLAPQAYLRITSIGLADPMGYVISVILIAVSILAMGLAARLTSGRDYSTVQRGGGGAPRRPLGRLAAAGAYTLIGVILALVLAPHVGLLLLSLSTVWSFSPLPDGYTLAHYGRVFTESGAYIWNTVLYASIAGVIDVVLGVVISYLVLRTKIPGRHWLDWTASAALAIPGVVIGIGYLRTFFGLKLPDGTSLASLWIMIAIALAIRRLPYALRACHAALQQVSASLEEASENLGANKLRTARRIVVPLMLGGMLAGFVTSFATSAVELSATLMLVQSSSDAPIAYGIYVFMQTPAGRGPGAALGVIAVLLVAVCSLLSNWALERQRALRAGK